LPSGCVRQERVTSVRLPARRGGIQEKKETTCQHEREFSTTLTNLSRSHEPLIPIDSALPMLVVAVLCYCTNPPSNDRRIKQQSPAHRQGKPSSQKEQKSLFAISRAATDRGLAHNGKLSSSSTSCLKTKTAKITVLVTESDWRHDGEGGAVAEPVAA
jgi:hypothetical protein